MQHTKKIVIVIGLFILLSACGKTGKNASTSSPEASPHQSEPALEPSYTLTGGVHFERVKDPLLGEVVWQDTRAEGLAWGDDINFEGYLKYLSWEEAKDHCLKLNPSHQQEAIRVALLQKDALGEPTKPDRGYFLPRFADWKQLAQAMSSGKSRQDNSGIFEGYSAPKWFFRRLAHWHGYYWAFDQDGIHDGYPKARIFEPVLGKTYDTTNTHITGQNKPTTNAARCVRAGEPW